MKDNWTSTQIQFLHWIGILSTYSRSTVRNDYGNLCLDFTAQTFVSYSARAGRCNGRLLDHRLPTKHHTIIIIIIILINSMWSSICLRQMEFSNIQRTSPYVVFVCPLCLRLVYLSVCCLSCSFVCSLSCSFVCSLCLIQVYLSVCCVCRVRSFVLCVLDESICPFAVSVVFVRLFFVSQTSLSVRLLSVVFVCLCNVVSAIPDNHFSSVCNCQQFSTILLNLIQSRLLHDQSIKSWDILVCCVRMTFLIHKQFFQAVSRLPHYNVKSIFSFLSLLPGISLSISLLQDPFIHLFRHPK